MNRKKRRYESSDDALGLCGVVSSASLCTTRGGDVGARTRPGLGRTRIKLHTMSPFRSHPPIPSLTFGAVSGCASHPSLPPGCPRWEEDSETAGRKPPWLTLSGTSCQVRHTPGSAMGASDPILRKVPFPHLFAGPEIPEHVASEKRKRKRVPRRLWPGRLLWVGECHAAVGEIEKKVGTTPTTRVTPCMSQTPPLAPNNRG